MIFNWAHAWPPAIAAFLASLVEFVEALTVVLAVGAVRGWSSALIGSGAALGVLLAIVVTIGPALTRIPLDVVQLAVGVLLLLFGMRWLRKAILRSAGVIPLHDEDAISGERGGAGRACCCRAAWLCRSQAFGVHSGEYPEVHGRCIALRLWDFLGRRRYGPSMAGAGLVDPRSRRWLPDHRIDRNLDLPSPVWRALRRKTIGCRPARPAAAERAHSGEHLPCLERFDEIVVRAEIEPGHPIIKPVARRDDQHRCIDSPPPRRLQKLKTFSARQPEVEQHNRMSAIGERGFRLSAGAHQYARR